MLENIAFVLDVIVFTILSTAWFFLPAFEFCQLEGFPPLIPVETQREERKKEPDFIDNQLLKARSYTINDGIFGIGCIIDGITFTETIKVESRFRQFEVYSINSNMDDYADTSGVSIDDDTHLQLSLQHLPNGVIINSNVYLSHLQWNTLCPAGEGLRCAVCGLPCDVTQHVSSATHMANMERYRPINKYDLAVTRKINNNYHCGVCNILFDQALKDEHFSSKEHENKMLFAINKVSDIMYDYNMHTNNNNFDDKKDSYHFNAKAINNNNIDLSSEESEDEYEYEDQYDYDKWNMNSHRYDDNDNNDDEYYYEEPPQNLANSYASMARKPKTDDLPAVLEIDLGNKKATVKFDSWNMVNRTKRRNLFYCMACKMYEHVRLKAEHCKGEAHVARLRAIPVVDTYERYLVRQVNDNLYHCGHCNNLQLIHEMEDHIESEHPNTNQTHLFDSPAKKLSTPVKIRSTSQTSHYNEIAATNEANIPENNDILPISNNVAKSNDIVAISNDIVGNNARINDKADSINSFVTHLYDEAGMYDELRSANSNFDDMVICAYGSKIRISKIAFNLVCQGEHDFYCGLCEVNISMDKLKVHLNDLQHLTLLHRTPFIEAFNIHLFREIRDALHCALCNELIQIFPDMILKHKILEKHIVKLARAVSTDEALVEAKPAANHSLTNNGATSNVNNKSIDVEAKTIHSNNVNGASTNTMKTTNNVATNVTKKDASITNQNVAFNNLPPPNISKKDATINTNIAPNGKNININVNEEQGNKTTKETPKDAAAKREADIIAAQIQAKKEEFVVVKNGVKEEIEDDLDESFTDDFDYEEYVYVKLGNTYIKITNTAYNTLVNIGDGGRYCFVCSSVVNVDMKTHVENRGHMENMEKFKFVDKYNEDLLRQFYLMYHCSICNVVVTRKQLNHHLTWPTHTIQRENTKISSKKRKSEIKNGTKQFAVTIEKENIYLNEKETDVKIFLNIAIEKELLQVEKKNKIVIFNDYVLKVSFDCWHGLGEARNGYRCKMCQCDFVETELGVHVSGEWHKANLEKIEKQYSPALIRKINDATLNCVICNMEITNNRNIVTEHVQGKKHVRHYEAILKDSSVANSYVDCDQDVLML